MQIPGYRIIRRIAQGGMSTVYLAIQISVGRVVALKVMSPTLNGDPAFSERFQREANIVGQLSHPNIVSIYDIGRHNNLNYIAMDYLAGGSVQDKMKEGLTPEDALRVTREIASALDHAHEKGYIHRDIKPENILFRADNSAVLSDFGVAKTVSAAKVTNAGTVVGTPHYMSPEQTRGKVVDARSDIYSLGVVFYEMLTGAVPYQGDQAVAIAIKHLAAPIPRLPEQFKAYQKLLDKLLSKEPDQRFQRGRDLVEAIEKLENDSKSSGAALEPQTDSVQIFILLKQLLAATLVALRNQLARLGAYLNTLRWTPKRGIYRFTGAEPVNTVSAESQTSANTVAATRIQKMATLSLINVRSQRLASWVLLSALIGTLAWALIDVGNEAGDELVAAPPPLVANAEHRAPTAVHQDPPLVADATESVQLPPNDDPVVVESPRDATPTASEPHVVHTDDSATEVETPVDELPTEEVPAEATIGAGARDAETDEVTDDEVVAESTAPAAPTPAPRFALTVEPTPANARVRIMNIRERYHPGIRLQPGRYQIEVSRAGYRTHLEWITLGKANKRYPVRLARTATPGSTFSSEKNTGDAGPEMVVVPAGAFTMGSDSQSSSQPLRRVNIEAPFAISKYEITFEQYEKFARATNRPLPGDNRWGTANRPVIYVSWESASAYAQWLSNVTGQRYRLPSEAEWEYVARTGENRDYWWGNDSGGANGRANCRRGCYSDHAGLLSSRTAPVDAYPASDFGVHNMAGNVAEWVQDCYQNHYAGTPTDGSAFEWEGCTRRVLRGGSHRNHVNDITSHRREHETPDYYGDHVGFRVVMELQ